MKAKLTIKMDNAAFDEGMASFETARILRDLARRLEGNPWFSPGYGQPLRDTNGNEVGYFQLTD